MPANGACTRRSVGQITIECTECQWIPQSVIQPEEIRLEYKTFTQCFQNSFLMDEVCWQNRLCKHCGVKKISWQDCNYLRSQETAIFFLEKLIKCKLAHTSENISVKKMKGNTWNKEKFQQTHFHIFSFPNIFDQCSPPKKNAAYQLTTSMNSTWHQSDVLAEYCWSSRVRSLAWCSCDVYQRVSDRRCDASSRVSGEPRRLRD